MSASLESLKQKATAAELCLIDTVVEAVMAEEVAKVRRTIEMWAIQNPPRERVEKLSTSEEMNRSLVAELNQSQNEVGVLRAEVELLRDLIPDKSQDSAGYRMLEPGEVIQDGDEYQSMSGDWKRFTHVMGYPVASSPLKLLRRPIPTPSLMRYRNLHPGEIRQPGDQILNSVNDWWCECTFTGIKIHEGSPPHRRPIPLDTTLPMSQTPGV